MPLLLAAPALPLDEAGKYVAGAYIVFLVLLIIYLAIMATKVQRIERELRELAGFAEQRGQDPTEAASISETRPQGENPGRGARTGHERGRGHIRDPSSRGESRPRTRNPGRAHERGRVHL